MKEIKNIFQPEIRPFHKVEFSVATVLDLTAEEKTKTFIPAGTLLKAASGEKAIEIDPTKGAKIATVADVAGPLAVLAHDVVLDGRGKYPVGVVVEGIVYEDVMKNANTKANFTEEIIKALAPKILTYGVTTLGVEHKGDE